VAKSLAELDPGESWIVSPGFLGSITRVRWNRRRTFDSGATPVAGMRRTAPVALADIDLAEISALMADTIERAKAEDPKELHRQIRDLEKQLAERTEPEPRIEFIEIPVLDEDLVVRAERVIEALSDHGRQVLDAFDALTENLGTARRLVAAAPTAATPTPAVAPRPAQQAPAARPRRQPTQGSAAGWPNDIGKAGRKILTVLAQHGQMTVTRLALQAGYSAQGGGFRNPMGALRTAGYIEGGLRGENVSLTTEGQAVIPADLPPLPTGDELIAHWVSQLPKAAALALQELADIWPDRISVDDLAARTGYEVSGGGFRNALGRLRTLELITGGLRGEPIGASDDLMAAT
jgi:hypothetical protein